MAAEVGTRVRRKEEEGQGNGSKQELITRDLLGGCAPATGSMELDLDLHVPPGWERHLDLLSGKTYLHKRSGDSPAISERRRQFQDLNLPPLAAAAAATPDDSSAAPDLGLVVPAAVSDCYQSVCTLETVRSALERAERESLIRRPRRRSGFAVAAAAGSTSPSSSTTSSSLKRRGQHQLDDGDAGSVDGSSDSAGAAGAAAGDEATMMAAAGCPGCLLYVLISRQNPRCPRCESRVPLPPLSPPPHLLLAKKLRIDLNSSSSPSEFS